MDARVGIIFLLVLGAGSACFARQTALIPIISDTLAMQIKNQEQEKEVKALDKIAKNDQVCTLCEEFVAQAVSYLSENKTQTEIIGILHKACSRVHSLKQECITMVDYYVPFFFLEISSVQPDDFCKEVNLCQEVVTISSQLQDDSCGICHRAVSEVLIKLKDPDSELEIIGLLLKGCNSMDKYAQKCKRLVFQYGPVILANAEQFLETTDICTMLHACYLPPPRSSEAATVLKADS